MLTLEDSRAVLPLLAEQSVGVLVLDLTRKPCGARTATKAWRPGCLGLSRQALNQRLARRKERDSSAGESD